MEVEVEAKGPIGTLFKPSITIVTRKAILLENAQSRQS